MTAKKVFVTGGAGQTGVQVVKWLSREGRNLDVWAGIRKGDPTQESAIRAFASVHSCVTDATDPRQLRESFQDVQDLFIVPSSTEDKVRLACNYIDAAREANVKFVLLLSVLGADRKDYSWGTQFHQIEEHLRESGLPAWCILRTPFYAQNLQLYKTQIQQGHLPLPIGEAAISPVDVEDVGRLASTILADCAPHKGKVYEITGAEALTGRQMAQVFTKALGTTVNFKDIPLEEARTILHAMNVPEVEVKGLLDFYKLTSTHNLWNKTTGDFERICGRKPKSLYEYLVENKTTFM